MQRTSHSFVIKFLLLQGLLAVLIAMPLKAQAQFDYSDYPEFPGDSFGPGQGQSIQADVRQQLRQGQTLPLLQTLGLNQQSLQGRELVQINVTGSSVAQRAQIQLIENQNQPAVSQPQELRRQVSTVALSLLVPATQLNSLKLKALGDVYIESVEAIVQDSYQPQPGGQQQMISAQVNRTVRGRQTIAVKNLITQQNPQLQLQGRDLERVILEARPLSNYSQATAQLLINGQRVGQPKRLESHLTRLAFPIQGSSRFGRDINSLQIEIVGDAIVDAVSVRLSQSVVQPPVRPARRISLSPMIDFNVRSSQRLVDALYLPSQHSQRLVSSITISASSYSRGAFALVDIGRGPLETITVDYSLSRTIYLPVAIPLADIGLNTTGQFRLEHIEIEFVR